MQTPTYDVLVVGAGLSGICAAYYLQRDCPERRFVLLESRQAIGGTWDLFRYPGIRSDSEMYTLGFSFRPWQQRQVIADGPAIREYLRETAAAFGIERLIQFGQQVESAAWSSEAACWRVAVRDLASGELRELTCSFLLLCGGYYSYESGYTPTFPGIERYTGMLFHPQQWPEGLDYTGKQILVIGSGATAVTLIPALAAQAAHVTMLQRSPTYVVPGAREDALANRLRRLLPASLAASIVRWRSILSSVYVYTMSRRRPETVRNEILKGVRAELGQDYPVDTHFNPRYNPWDQRICLAADSDFFKVIKNGQASVVTDQIETFTEHGVRLISGQELAADIIITATGLNLRPLNGIQLLVDGQPVAVSQTLSYKGMMYSNVPNLASVFGYTNASWTLKCELIVQAVCRLLNHMQRHGLVQVTPTPSPSAHAEQPLFDFTSGYIQRGMAAIPRQGQRDPWRVYQNYLRDLWLLRYRRVNDTDLLFR